MLINFRNAMMSGKRTPTAKDYVQTGLVAMWDGIENAGWGVHDASATTWKDLVGTNDMTLVGSPTWTDYGMLVDGSSKYTNMNATSGVVTMEVGVTIDGGASSRRYICVISPTSAIYERYIFLIQNKLWVSRNSKTITAESNLFDGTISVVYGSGDSNSVDKIYKLGVESETTPINDYWSGATPGINRYGSYYFTGTVRFIRLYSRALTASEIAANYAIDKARFNLP